MEKKGLLLLTVAAITYFFQDIVLERDIYVKGQIMIIANRKVDVILESEMPFNNT